MVYCWLPGLVFDVHVSFFIAGLTPLKHEYHYTGELSVPEPSTAGRMQVQFPLSELKIFTLITTTDDIFEFRGE